MSDVRNGKWVICVRQHFDAGHRLYRYPGKCKYLHGHRWRVEVGVAVKELDDLGIGVDFGDIKKVLKKIAEEFDHGLLLFKEDPLVDVLKDKGMKLILLNANPSAETIANVIYEKIEKEIEGVRLEFVRVYETEDTWVEFRKS